MTQTAFEATGFSYSVAVKPIPPATTIPAMTGATVLADALNQDSGVRVAGVGSVVDAATVAGIFAPWSLTPGTWKVQTRVTVAGSAQQTLQEEIVNVRASAAVHP